MTQKLSPAVNSRSQCGKTTTSRWSQSIPLTARHIKDYVCAHMGCMLHCHRQYRRHQVFADMNYSSTSGDHQPLQVQLEGIRYLRSDSALTVIRRLQLFPDSANLPNNRIVPIQHSSIQTKNVRIP
jgi:hypothetical protein